MIESKNELPLKPGKQYTMVRTNSMAITTRMEFVVLDKKDGCWEISFKGNKRIFKLDPEKHKSSLIFEGWDLPFTLDFETKSFAGNALLNFIAEPKFLRKYIEGNNLNPSADLGRVIAWTDEQAIMDRKGRFAFLEKAEEMRHSHAVVDRILEKGR